MSKIITVLVVGVMLMTDQLVIAQTPSQESFQAIADVQRDARADYQQGTGFCLGAGCGLFGVGASYLYEGKIPTHRLAHLEGKSDTYILVYREEYVKEIQRKRTRESIEGYVVGIIITLGLIAATVASAMR